MRPIFVFTLILGALAHAAAAQPHVVEGYLVTNEGPDSALIHFWFDGTDQWSETVGHLEGVVALAMSDTLGLIGLDAEDHRLVRIDRSNAVTTPLVSLDTGVEWMFSDIAVAPDGAVWLLNSNTLFTVDTSDGATTVVGQTGLDVDRFEFHAGGLFGGGTNQFLEIDPETGEASLIADYSSPWSTMAVVALASDGDQLWGGTWGFGSPQPGQASLSVSPFDTATGDHSDTFFLPLQSWDFPPCDFVVLRQQPTSPAIPASGPHGLAVLTILIALAGFAALHSKTS